MNSTIALVGNPNCGKTTLYNALTGSKQHVGNWPGVTVEKKEGQFTYKNQKINVVDLPGIYSLSPYSMEEIISRDYIVKERPDLVVNIVDASNIERNFYLTTQLLELNVPVVVALNMMDVAETRGISVDVKKLEEQIGVPVIPIVASKNKGLEELKNKIAARFDESKRVTINDIFSQEVKTIIESLKPQFKNSSDIKEYDASWVALKVLEADQNIIEKTHMKIDQDFSEYESLIIEQRYDFIEKIMKSAIISKGHQKQTASDKIDAIVTNKLLGIPIFAAIMYITFWLTFNVGNIFLDMIDGGFGSLGETVGAAIEGSVPAWFQSLLVDGIIAGVGAVLTFLPGIMFLFLMVALLEDTGYMARVAYIMDRAMRKIGLSGKAFVPMLMGFGCTVPAIMATRTMEDKKDRLTAILITPFMSCGARMPIYVLFGGIFFPEHAALVTFSLYFLGIFVAIAMAWVFKNTLFKGDEAPFIMEMPPYRIPTFKTTGLHVWEKVKDYIMRAGTVIFAASVLIWFLMNFGVNGMIDFNNPEEIMTSFGYIIGSGLGALLAPIGFGNWQSGFSLLTGLIAKEAIISNMAIIYGAGAEIGEAAVEGDVLGFAPVITQYFTYASAYAFMVFSLLYTPCIAVIGVIKKETNSWKWTGFSIAYQLIVAWVVSFVSYKLIQLLGLPGGYIGTLVVLSLVFVVFRESKTKKNVDKNQHAA